MAATIALTVDQFLTDYKSCYPRSTVEDLFAGRPTITAAAILEAPIPDHDKIIALMNSGLLAAEVRVLLKQQIADHFMPDKTSVEYMTFMNAEGMYSWLPICDYLTTAGMIRADAGVLVAAFALDLLRKTIES